MKVIIPDVPEASLKFIAKELEPYGAKFQWVTARAGTIQHISGEANFSHDGEGNLTVAIDNDEGHFGDGFLLKGGIRQFVEDAVEDWYRDYYKKLPA